MPDRSPTQMRTRALRELEAEPFAVPPGAGRGGCRCTPCPARLLLQPEPHRDVDLLRPGLRRLGRVHRPGQLRHQHPGRNAVWLPPALGAAVVEHHGDAHPVPRRQAGHRHRTHPAAELPQALLPAHDLALWIAAEIAAVATDLAEFLGAAHRPRSPLRPAAHRPRLQPQGDDAGGRAGLHRPGLRLPRARPHRLPLAGARHHGLRRHHRRLLRLRDLPRPPGLEAGNPLHPAAHARPLLRAELPRQHLRRGRHAGRNRDAARRLSALRAGAAAPEGAHRLRAACRRDAARTSKPATSQPSFRAAPSSAASCATS